MSRIDVDSLLKEVSAEFPCGENLEYDPEFGEMERATQGKPEQQIGDTLIQAEEPDWPKINKKVVSLFKRTKDLRSAVYFTQALLHTDGLLGLRDGLKLIQGLLEKFWDTVHPQLDPADNNDPTLRINTLLTLCDPATVLQSIREATLVKSSAFGKITLRDILVSSGKFTLPTGSKEKILEQSTIDAAFMIAQLDEMQSIADAIRQSLESIAAIETLLMDKVGAKQMADFSTLPNLLKEAQQIMTEHLSQRGATESDAATEETAAKSGTAKASRQINGEINSREDVIRVLDMACEYFSRHEPSSPVPLLLQRAKRLVSKDFMEILRDLVPTGVSQAEQISGVINQK